MPDDAVTREQLMQIIRNYAEYKGINVSASAELKAFNDSSTISSWAEDAFIWGVATGMISGAGKNSLLPKDSATRAQVAKILTEFDKNIMMRA